MRVLALGRLTSLGMDKEADTRFCEQSPQKLIAGINKNEGRNLSSV
jgi:hypothetical protein